MTSPMEIPETIPVMTLPGLVFFPHALQMLYIVEPRYQKMLSDISSGKGIFAISQLDPKAPASEEAEPPCPFMCVGVIKACAMHLDGTAHLVLQGIARARLIEIVREKPYRMARIAPIIEQPGDTEENLESLGRSIQRLVSRIRRASNILTPENNEHIQRHQDDPAALADTVSDYLVNDTALRRRLLECPNVAIRLQRLQRHLRSQAARLEFDKLLRNGLPESGIGLN